MATYRRGDIVFARVADPGGGSIDHDRPVILWTPTTKIAAGSAIHCIVISHQVTKPYPRRHAPMPWSPGGHPVTRLWLDMDLIYVELAARFAEKQARSR